MLGSIYAVARYLFHWRRVLHDKRCRLSAKLHRRDKQTKKTNGHVRCVRSRLRLRRVRHRNDLICDLAFDPCLMLAAPVRLPSKFEVVACSVGLPVADVAYWWPWPSSPSPVNWWPCRCRMTLSSRQQSGLCRRCGPPWSLVRCSVFSRTLNLEVGVSTESRGRWGRVNIYWITYISVEIYMNWSNSYMYNFNYCQLRIRRGKGWSDRVFKTNVS